MLSARVGRSAAVIIAVGLLAGCGQAGSQATTGSTGSTTTPTTLSSSTGDQQVDGDGCNSAAVSSKNLAPAGSTPPPVVAGTPTQRTLSAAEYAALRESIGEATARQRLMTTVIRNPEIHVDAESLKSPGIKKPMFDALPAMTFIAYLDICDPGSPREFLGGYTAPWKNPPDGLVKGTTSEQTDQDMTIGKIR